MADRFAILGQVLPTSASEEQLYLVPPPAEVSYGSAVPAPKAVSEQTQTVISSIIVCNQQSSERTYRIRLKTNDDVSIAPDNDKEFLFYDTAIGPNKTQILSLGLTLGASNQIKVSNSGSTPWINMSFTAMGIEVT